VFIPFVVHPVQGNGMVMSPAPPDAMMRRLLVPPPPAPEHCGSPALPAIPTVMLVSLARWSTLLLAVPDSGFLMSSFFPRIA
jgi:hypothetical protein